MTDHSEQKKGLVDLMAEKQTEEEINEILNAYFSNSPQTVLNAVKTFLTVATFQKVGALPKDFWPDNLDAAARSSIILAEMCVDLAWGKDSNKIKIPEGAKQVIEQAKSEVDYFYSIILSIGIKGVKNREEKWKEACLNRYEDSKKGFQYIKKQHLANTEIYSVDDTNSKRDFHSKLFQIIILESGFGKINKELLYQFSNSFKK